MNPNELMSSAGETLEYAKQYIRQQIDYLRLETAEKIAKATSSLITAMIVSILVFMVLILLSIGLAFYLGALFDSYPLAFLSIGGFYAVIAAVVIALKKKLITNPVLNIVIKNIME